MTSLLLLPLMLITNVNVLPKAAFILDDTIDIRTGGKTENVSYIHDHVRAVRKSACVDKITSALMMLKRARKHRFKANYVLVDSWFLNKGFISTVREIKNGAMHVICVIIKDFRQYTYNGQELNAKELLKIL